MTALVFGPALGGLLLLLFEEGHHRLRRGVTILFGSVPLLVLSVFGETPPARPWIPGLGVSFEIGFDTLSRILVGWVALLVPLTVLTGQAAANRRASILVLTAGTALSGLFLARDGFLLFAFYGLAIAVTTLLADGAAMRRLFLFQTAGLASFAAFFVLCHRIAYEQSGLSSSALARFSDLVLDPAFAGKLFLLGLAGSVFVLPLVPFAAWHEAVASSTPPHARRILFGGCSLLGSYLLLRLVLPVVAESAESWATAAARTLAVVSMTYAALTTDGALRSLSPPLSACQALVLLGLLSGRDEGMFLGQIQMLHLATGWTGLTFSSSRWLSLVAVAAPGLAALYFVWRGSPVTATLAALAYAIMALRFVRAMGRRI